MMVRAGGAEGRTWQRNWCCWARRARLPVAGRGGTSSALIAGDRVFVVDCGRGSPSAYANARLGFSQLTAVFLTHLHADHVGDLPGLLLYPWGLREGADGPLPPVRVYG